jgi:glutamate carboxypeptidase
MSQRDLRQAWQSFSHEKPEMLELLAELVRRESPSRDKQALDRLALFLSDQLRQAGGAVEIIEHQAAGNHVLSRFSGPPEQRAALVLGHFDTVWPRGTLDRLPFRLDGAGRAFGPGIFDMKAGVVLILSVMKAINHRKTHVPRPIWVLLTSDEEIGSPSSRALIESLARQCAYVLVLEPPLPDGALKTARKGVGRFRVEIAGRAAHAGVAPAQGRSAIVELAHQVIRLEALQDPAAGTSVNVGVIEGGTSANVVPARAAAEIDVRVAARSEEQRLAAALHALRPATPDVRISVSGGFARPPMERTPSIAALFEQAREIARAGCLELSEGQTGGGSDGSFTAALGIPTLDGLGAMGGGAHADDEHIVDDSLPERASLLLALLLLLQVEP